MKIVIAYSHVDAEAALRLLAWLKFLGGVPAPLLVVSTVRAATAPCHKKIVKFVTKHFPGSETWTLPDEDERGWPKSASHIFGRAIEHAADDVFWLEPDAIPVRAGWFEPLLEEYLASGKTFAGRRVPPGSNHPTHMTGIGFYGKNWREPVPNLCQIVKGGHGAWDVDHSVQILADFHETKLIQHKWVRNEFSQDVPLASLEKGISVYHQCKTGALMRTLRPDFYSDPLTLEAFPLLTVNTMPKFYLNQNAAKPIEVGGKKFAFELCEYFPPTATWWGSLKTDNPDEALLLDTQVERGIIETISQADYDKLEVKKNKTPSKPNLVELPPWQSPQMGGPKAAVPAVEVAGKVPSAAEETVSDILEAKPAAKPRGRNK